MISDYDYKKLLYETLSRVIQASSHPSYLANVKDRNVNGEMNAVLP